ncbi:AraC family transcriptional regulator [Paenibacillus sp. ACRSA]|uniref:helix-turn-helix transcriptional regulator n=1 Tax=Paenibacillus sp. ACRSA TaxID=2918211 RepID=UPI001EF70DE2|nr:AraC family transcriptional regulator [Paenibacillus sp. ACRSA]MCG7378572.1 AraC family transcriptional regulator [Paenibacillus sp. ACRSA]
MIELELPPIPYFLGAGRTEYSTGDHHPHRSKLGIYDLLIVAEGGLFMGENGSEWRLLSGDMLLLLPDGEHYSFQPCTEDTLFYWIHFEHEVRQRTLVTKETSISPALYSSRPFENPYMLRLPKYLRLPDPQAVYDIIEQLLTLPTNATFWREQQLLGNLLSILEESGSRETESVATRLAERAATYIQAHYQNKVTHEMLAEALHFHPNYIVRCMKARYGCTPSDYLQEIRLDRARRLLVTTDWSIDRVAEEVGFRYSPYFSACFKRKMGISPLQFRKQYLK